MAPGETEFDTPDSHQFISQTQSLTLRNLGSRNLEAKGKGARGRGR